VITRAIAEQLIADSYEHDGISVVLNEFGDVSGAHGQYAVVVHVPGG
jgi:hypothetical protein